MKLMFLGAAENVTGSRHLVETDGARILVDCGLYQEREFLTRNWDPFPVEPASLTHVVLTHAHLDHCGYLPRLVRDGFAGDILCTPPTAEIARVVMLDAAKLQAEDVRIKQERHLREGKTGPHPLMPLYTVEDALKAASLFRTYDYGGEIAMAENAAVSFHDAGHILGAGMARLRIGEGGKTRTLVFSGDIGRWEQTVLCPPTLFEGADIVVMESTYGNRVHDPMEASLRKLCGIIDDTVKKGGNIIIPAFAVERSQELLFFLVKFQQENRLPSATIFVDSPMAIEVNRIFGRHPEYFSGEMRRLLEWGRSPLEAAPVVVTPSVEESKAIGGHGEPCIIIAGSGMCVGGRIKHHLVQNIGRPECAVLFVGYQSRGTLGREILERPSQVRIFGEIHPVRARIEKINGLSAHADRDELLRWFAGFEKQPEKVFLVHGEKDTIQEFAGTLAQRTTAEVVVPKYLEEFSW